MLCTMVDVHNPKAQDGRSGEVVGFFIFDQRGKQSQLQPFEDFWVFWEDSDGSVMLSAPWKRWYILFLMAQWFERGTRICSTSATSAAVGLRPR